MLHEVLVGVAVSLLLFAGVIQLSWCRCPRRYFTTWYVDDPNRPDSLPSPESSFWIVGGTASVVFSLASLFANQDLPANFSSLVAVLFAAIVLVGNIVILTNARNRDVQGPGYVISFFQGRAIKEGEKVHLKPWQFFVSSLKVFHGSIKEVDGNVLDYKLVLVGTGRYRRNLREMLKQVHLEWMHATRKLAKTMPTAEWSTPSLELVPSSVIIRDLELKH